MSDDFVDEESEYHVAIRITRGPGGYFIYQIDIDLPGKRGIKHTNSAKTLDSARSSSREMAKYLLSQEMK